MTSLKRPFSSTSWKKKKKRMQQLFFFLKIQSVFALNLLTNIFVITLDIITSHFMTNECRINPHRPLVLTAHLDPFFFFSFLILILCAEKQNLSSHFCSLDFPLAQCIFSATTLNPRNTEVDWAHKQIRFPISSLCLSPSLSLSVDQMLGADLRLLSDD